MQKYLRWGILGAARIARSAVGPAIQASRNSRIHAIASRDPEKAADFARQFGVPKSYADYASLLADPEVEAVYLPLPNAYHEEWSILAAEAGKHVLCEKPLAHTASSARRMVDAFSRSGLLLAEAFMYRFHPLTETVLQLVREGRIGTPQMARASFVAAGQDSNDIRYQPELGGGAMLDLGSYCVGFLRLLAGEEPRSVTATGKRHRTGVDIAVSGSMIFPSGLVGYFGTAMGMPFECGYEVWGDRGRIRVDQGALVAWPGGRFSIRLWADGAEETIPIPPANHYQRMVEDFADSVHEGRPPRFPAGDAIANLEVIEKVLAQIPT